MSEQHADSGWSRRHFGRALGIGGAGVAALAVGMPQAQAHEPPKRDVHSADFNVTPSTSATRNTLAIRRAIASGHVSLAPGVYPVSRTGPETELFLIEKAIEFDGNGAKLIVDDGTPTTVDIFRFIAKDTFPLFAIEQYGPTPTRASAGTVGLYVHDFEVYSNTVADHDSIGRHALHIDLDAAGTNWFRNVHFERITAGGFSGSALRVSNSTKTDGIFVSTFSQLNFYGGIRVERGGDSLTFNDISIKAMPNEIAVDVDLVPGAGALLIESINGEGGTGLMKIVLTGNSCAKIQSCDMEQYVGNDSPTGALAYFEGGMDWMICDNRFLKIFPAGVPTPNSHGLALSSAAKATILNNQVQGSGTGNDLDVDAACTNTYAPLASNRCFRGSYSNAGTNRSSI